MNVLVGELAEAERIASWMRGLSVNDLPVHLPSIALRLGVHSISRGPMDSSASTTVVDGKLAVRLNSDSTIGRTRFSLAHELAHVALGELAPERIRDEDLCNLIAGALLIPEEFCTQILSGRRLCIQTIVGIANSCKSSFLCTVRRIAVLKNEPLWGANLEYRHPIWKLGHASHRTRERHSILLKQREVRTTGGFVQMPIEVGGQEHVVHSEIALSGLRGRMLCHDELLAPRSQGVTKPT